MVFKWSFIVILGFAIGLYEATIRTFLPIPLHYLTLLMPLLVLFVVIERTPYAYVLAISSGLVMDLYSIECSGLYFWRLLLMVAILDATAKFILTNRSIYATSALMVLSGMLDFVFSFSVGAFFRWYLACPQTALVWRDIGLTLALEVAVCGALFFIGVRVFKRLTGVR
ncbi:MAG: hypothetical protein RDU25_02850 [Patescibacteria group bacterium]|nr:hypothetical protein [Patescibacteria group bacterium]